MFQNNVFTILNLLETIKINHTGFWGFGVVVVVVAVVVVVVAVVVVVF